VAGVETQGHGVLNIVTETNRAGLYRREYHCKARF
jgi:hypothetical protein